MKLDVPSKMKLEVFTTAWVDISGPTTNIKIDRSDADVGLLTAEVLDASLDPVHADTIRPGNKVRVRVLDGVTWRAIYTGLIDNINVDYEPLAKAGKQVNVRLSGSDNVSYMANTPELFNVSSINSLRWLLGYRGVPFTINGMTTSLSSPGETGSTNDNGSLWDAVQLAKDSALGYAWVDKDNRVRAYDSAQMDNTIKAYLTPNVYRSIDTDFNLDQVINSVVVKWRRYVNSSSTTVEIPYPPVEDEVSIGQWGRRQATFTISGAVESGAVVNDFATKVLARSATAVVRPHTADVRLDDTADIALGLLDLNDRVQVTLTDGTTNHDMRIGSIRHDITAKTWDVTFGFVVPASVSPPNNAPGTGVSRVANGSIGVDAFTDELAASLESANGKNRVYHLNTEPTDGPFVKGDTWFETDNGNKIHTWNGTAWVAVVLDTAAIADAAIVTSKIDSGAVLRSKIANTAIDASKIDEGAVTTTKIGNAAITNAKIGQAAVTEAKIDNLAVTTAKIDDLAVNGAKIANAAIGTAKIADAAIVSAKIGDAQIINAKIADGTITNAKIANLDAGKITTGELDAARIGVNTIQARHLTLGDVTNYLPPLSEWVGSTATYSEDAVGPVFVMRGNGSSNTHVYMSSPASATDIPVTPGEEFHFSWDVYANYPGYSGNGAVPYGTFYNGAYSGNGVTYGPATPQGSNGYTTFEYSFKVPAGAVWLRWMPYSSANGRAAVRNVSLRRKNGGNLLVDGAIDGKLITGATIQTAKTGNRTVIAGDRVDFWRGLAGEQYPGHIGPATLAGRPATIMASGLSTSQPSESYIHMYAGVGRTYTGGGTEAKVVIGGNMQVMDGMNVAGTVHYWNGANVWGNMVVEQTVQAYALRQDPSRTTGAAGNCYIALDGALWRSTSSRRYKESIAPLDVDVSKLLELEPVTFETKDGDGTRYAGFIAEQADEVGLTEYVDYDEDGNPDAFHYSHWTAALQKIVRDQQAQLDAQAKRIDELESRLGDVQT